MKKLALVLGLSAVIYSFLILPLAFQLLVWVTFDLPYKVVTIGSLAAAFFVAMALTPLVESEEQPPVLLTKLLFFGAAYFLLFKLLGIFEISIGLNKFSRFLHRVEGWSLIAVALLLSRFFKPRLMLFVGLLAFALQFEAVGVIAPLVLNFPKWVLNLVSLAVAIFIARSFCVGDHSPADRVTRPFFLWLFAAAGTFAMIADAGIMSIYGWKEKLVWVAFLVSFVLLIEYMAPEDPEPRPEGLGADYGRMFLVLVAFTVVVAVVFQFFEVFDDWVPYTWGPRAQFIVPLLACALVAVGLMKYLKISVRLPDHPPGRKMILWGVILLGVGILAGGSIVGSANPNGGMIDALVLLVFLAIAAVPFITLAWILLGTGLLRLLFSLNARPRG